MPYLNTSSGLSFGRPIGSPPATPTPMVQQTPQPQPVASVAQGLQAQPAPNDIGSMLGGVLGHFLRSNMAPQQPGQPMQLTGANPQTAPIPQGGFLSQLIASLGQPAQPQQAPSGGTRFVNGLNVVS